MKRLLLFLFFFLGLFFSIQSFAQCEEKLGSLPSIGFKGTGSKLTISQKKILAGVSEKLKDNPNCRITITGYCGESKRQVAYGTARVQNILKYLVEEEGISADRITMLPGQEGGDCNAVDLRPE